MGHSQAVSEIVYQAWISDVVWVERALTFIWPEDKPERNQDNIPRDS